MYGEFLCSVFYYVAYGVEANIKQEPQVGIVSVKTGQYEGLGTTNWATHSSITLAKQQLQSNYDVMK